MIRRLQTIFWQWWYRHHPSPSHFTKEDAIKIAREHNLESEVIMAMENGCNPDESLQDWDIYPNKLYNNQMLS